ncbi:hypothetical protein YPPY93_4830, partial [Yersinia pestis PY-93]
YRHMAWVTQVRKPVAFSNQPKPFPEERLLAHLASRQIAG